jgi:hypothetical protein
MICADEVIGNQLTSDVGHFPDVPLPTPTSGR